MFRQPELFKEPPSPSSEPKLEPIPEPKRLFAFDPFEDDVKRRKKKKKKGKVRKPRAPPKIFSPSVKAITTGITTTKQPRFITGFEARPLKVRKKRKRIMKRKTKTISSRRKIKKRRRK